MRWLMVALAVGILGATWSVPVEAGCRWCRGQCRHNDAFRSRAPAAAPPAAVYYQAMILAPVTAAPVSALPSAASARIPSLGGITGLLSLTGGSDLEDLVTLLEMVRGVRDRGRETREQLQASEDMSQVLAALKRLEAGQEYLKGQHINTASILRALGEQIVAGSSGSGTGARPIEDQLKALNDRLDATGPLMEKLNTIEGKLRDLQDAIDTIHDDWLAGES